MEIEIDTSSLEPAYEQIVRQIHLGIKQGALPPGTPLPPIRQLASDLLLNPNTVAKAYKQLEAQRVITTGGPKGSLIHAEARANSQAHRLEQARHRMKSLIGELRASGLSPSEIEEIFFHARA